MVNVARPSKSQTVAQVKGVLYVLPGSPKVVIYINIRSKRCITAQNSPSTHTNGVTKLHTVLIIAVGRVQCDSWGLRREAKYYTGYLQVDRLGPSVACFASYIIVLRPVYRRPGCTSWLLS